MKKVFLTLGMCLFLSVLAFAQTEDRSTGITNSKGQHILPQAGDFAIGIDAAGLLNYVGNMFNGNTNNSAKDIFNYNGGLFGGTAIFGKYFLSDKAAVRARLNVGIGSSTEKEGIEPSIIQTKTNSTTIGLTAGYELRRGYGRLQGFFGPEIGIGFMANDVTTTTFNGAGSSVEETKYPSKFAIKAGGFAGVEYFILPKFSIGGELGLAFQYINKGKLKITDTNGDVTESDGSNNFDFGTAYSGAVNVIFYF